MSVRTNTLAGILVGVLVAGASVPLHAQDPVTRPATPDSAKVKADKKAADARAAAGIHAPDTSGYRAMGDTSRAVLATECVDTAGVTTGNAPRPADLPARTQGRTDTTSSAAVAGDTTAVRADTAGVMAARTATPCPPSDSARTGQTGAARDTVPGSQPFNRDSAQTAPRQRGEDLPGTAGGTAPNTTPRDPNQRVDSDSDSTRNAATPRGTTTRGITTTRDTTTRGVTTPPTTAAPR